jgi:hypothetical protein
MDGITISAFSYYGLSKYLLSKKYDFLIVDKILSTINSVNTVSFTPFFPKTTIKLFNGYMMYDFLNIILNKNMFKKNFKEYILHHACSISAGCAAMIYNRTDIIMDFYKLEFTVPITNILWICHNYNIKNCNVTMLKILLLLTYSYYRIYYTLMLLYKYYNNNSNYLILFTTLSFCLLNINWYIKIIRIALK